MYANRFPYVRHNAIIWYVNKMIHSMSLVIDLLELERELIQKANKNNKKTIFSSRSVRAASIRASSCGFLENLP